MSHTTKRLLVWIVLLVMVILHFDFWWFDRVDPILFGFIPFAMWFQVLVGGILASIFLYFAYKVIWPNIPDHFEDEE